MMDCGKKTLILLTFCALVGAKRFQTINKNLDILISVPSTHIGDTEIGTAIFTVTRANPFLYKVVAQKNETQCINSTDVNCTSIIKQPTVDVSVSLSASDGKGFTYSNCFNRSQRLEILVDPEAEAGVLPQIVDGESEEITVYLDIRYNTTKTSQKSLRSRRSPSQFSLNAEFTTTTNIIIEDDNGPGNGQSALCCGPLSALILLALFPVLLLK